VAHYEDFPSFKKGLHKYRPRSQTPHQLGLTRLSLAGDWLSTSFPSALMERAVATGREAANVVLQEEGIRQVPLPVTTSHGPGLRVLAS
jgi:isorenieratene synthase